MEHNHRHHGLRDVVLNRLFCFLMIATLSACGGGGGDTGDGGSGPGTGSGGSTTQSLRVTVSGQGLVTSAPAGLNCSSDCTQSFAANGAVVLTASAAAGSTFGGWGGACSGTGTCTVTMNAAKSVTASFSATPPNNFALTVTTNGSGTVTSSPAGINCGSTCTANFSSGTSVTLTAGPSSGSTFSGWSGACSGTGTCSVTMSAAKNVTATFTSSGGGAVHVPTSWQSRGIGAGGALYSPSFNPTNDNHYYVSSDMSQVFHTTNFGSSYAVVNFSQLQGGTNSAVRFTNNSNILYSLSYAGGNASFPVKSTDGGATWNALAGNPLQDDEVYSLYADYNNPSRVVLSGWGEIYLSNNGGSSFSNVWNALTGDGVALVGAFFDGNNIYLGTSDGLLVSTNGGSSFSNAGTSGFGPGEMMLSFTGAKVGGQMRFFALTGNSNWPGMEMSSNYWGNIRGIYSLDNGSGSWAPKMNGVDINSDFLMFIAMAQNDLNTVYAAGSMEGVPEVMKTTNGGVSWTRVFNTTNNQNIQTGWSGDGGDRGWSYGEIALGFTVAPNNSSKVLISDLGFVHRTSDGGATWQQAYVSAADQHAAGTTNISKASYHSVGLEDTSVWQLIWADAQNMFAAFSDIRGIRSIDGGASWSFNYTGHTANTMYRVVRHPVTSTLYAATSGVHDMYQSTRLADDILDDADSGGKIIFSTNKGATWANLRVFNHPVFWLELDPTNTNRLYASVIHSTQGGVFVTSDLQNGASSTWVKIPNPPRAVGHPASLVVLNDGKLVATFSGRRTGSGFQASSGVFIYNPATALWTDVSHSGMHYWTKDIVIDPNDALQNTWYVGVFSGWGGPSSGLGGLYRTTDRGANWTRVNNLDRVTSITFTPGAGGDAYLTTETDGLWHTNDVNAASPVFSRVTNYPFRQPERVYFNPFNTSEIWVTSFGNGLSVGNVR